MSAPITSAGAYPNISAEAYHGTEICPAPSIGSSGLKTLLFKSPYHYWYDSPLNPSPPQQDDKPHLNMGKAVHDMLLLGERWPDHYFVLPEEFNARKTKEQAELHAERAEAFKAGKVVLTFDENERVKGMVRAVQGNKLAMATLTAGEPEITLAWQDKATGVWLRARPDWTPFSVINGAAFMALPDLKTALDVTPSAFSRAIANHGYHMSAALYADGCKAVYGNLPTHHFHIVVESKEPHCVALYQLPGEDVERGRSLNRFAINAFADCLAKGKWPQPADVGDNSSVAMCGLPYWERKRIDEGTTTGVLAWDEA